MRLVTRSDFDGLVAGMILKELGMVDDIKFVHPKDVQDGVVELSDNDITTNLPFDRRVHIAFDHHSSEVERADGEYNEKLVIDEDARSAAEVVYRYYNNGENLKRITPELLEACGRSDSADWTQEDILAPTGWALMSFVMDARTGLGRFRDFRISNYDLMMMLIDYCPNHTVDEVLALPDVQERVSLYMKHQRLFEEQLRRVARLENGVVVLDMRNEDIIYAGNRFMVYAMFPEAKYSIHVVNGKGGLNVPIMVGKSIINKSGTSDIGGMCLEYGGGGHRNAGTCQVSAEDADKVVNAFVRRLR